MKRIHKLVGMALGLAMMLGSCSKEYGYDFQNGYNSGEYADTVDADINTDPFKIDYSKYTQARLFPGLIDQNEPRLTDFLVQIDLDYEEIRASDLRISVAPGNWQSTGVYAPAGELITIDVPIGVYGLTAQISPHVATSLDGIDFPRRDAEIYNRMTLFPGKNYMRNLYGGLVYILPSRPLGRIVDLYFSGIAKAPSFKLSGPGATTNEEWKEMVEKTTVPWFELEGDRIVFTLETEKLKRMPIEDPTLLMQTWDKAIREGYWDWTGMTEGNPDIRHRAPFNKWRIVHDVLFKPGVAQVSGYPVRAGNTENYFRQATTVEAVKNSNWGTYHELGHNMQMGSTWSFAGNGEVTNNVFHFGVSWLVFGQQSYKIAEVWSKAVPYIAETKSPGTGGMNWSAMDVTGNAYRSSAHDIRLMMWAQILEKYGYDFWTYIYKRGREARFTSANDQSKVDFFYEALSEFTGIDMLPYLNSGWGLYPSTVSQNFIKTRAKYKGMGATDGTGLPMLNRQVWNFNPVTRTGGDEEIPRVRFELSRADWTATANSETESRPASKLLQDNTASTNANDMWHPCTVGGTTSTCANGSIQTPAGQGAFTWEITIDTKASRTANGFIVAQRKNGNSTDNLNHVTGIKVYKSNNGTTWEQVGGRYSLQIGNAYRGVKQFINFHSDEHAETFRYIQFRIDRPTDVNGDSNAALNELGLFTY